VVVENCTAVGYCLPTVTGAAMMSLRMVEGWIELTS